MMAPIPGLRDITQRLRELEAAIATQRKSIAESSGRDHVAERRHLGRLLTALDQMLKECELTQQRAAETGKCDVISSPLRRRVEQPADTVRSAYLF
jgi:uncharacterized coiled-coil protein SlyX